MRMRERGREWKHTERGVQCFLGSLTVTFKVGGGTGRMGKCGMQEMGNALLLSKPFAISFHYNTIQTRVCTTNVQHHDLGHIPQ